MDPVPHVPSFRTVGTWLLSTTLLAAAGLSFAGRSETAPATEPVQVVATPVSPSPTGTPQEEAKAPDPDREASCREAAGLPEGVRTDTLPGSDSSTEVLLRNCVKNPGSKGLLKALERHARNKARIDAKRVARQEKAKERAERRAGKQAGGGSSAAKPKGGKGGGKAQH